MVGPNNAGKSTSLDAFRIAFDCLRYAKRKSPRVKSHGGHGVCSTWTIPSSVIQTDLRYCVHNFGDGISSIDIKIDNGNSFIINVSNGGSVECYLLSPNPAQKNSRFLVDQFDLDIVVVPTLSPLEQNEDVVQQATIDRNRYSRLASRNFRNYWLHQPDDKFESFADLVEEGWPGIRVQKPEIERGRDRSIVRMYFRQGPHVREVQWAGFGFQVWMQTMMHLSQASENSVLVLDEPDIYLHPDLQHRLLNIISERIGQYFIATHSTEIINDVDPGDVLIIRSEARGAKRIQNNRDYPAIYAAIGSSENAQFARLARTKKVLYFEGKDAKLLSKLEKVLLGTQFISSSSITIMKTDGFANWSRVSTSSWVFKNFFDFHVPVAALFDRDYKCDAEVDAFIEQVNNDDTSCHVLPFKELENILLVPRAIKEVIKKYAANELPQDWELYFDSTFDLLCDNIKTRILSQRIGSRLDFESKQSGSIDAQTLSAHEERYVSENWDDVYFRKKVVPGKEVFSEIAKWVQEEFTVTITSTRVIEKLQVNDIDPRFFEILNEIKLHLEE